MLELINVKKYFQKRISSWSRVRDFFSPKYERFEALKWINFQVKQWEKVAFIWPNWAWKSTTIKCMLWIMHNDEWEIRLFWKDPRKYRKDLSASVSSVFGQRSQLLYTLPLRDSFWFFKIIYGIPDQQFNDRLNKFIERFKIQDFIDTPVRKLSLWQRMKWEIIASLLHGPKALFLDEPTVGLDIIAKKVMYEILMEIHKEENITIFLTSHDLKDVETICNRAIIINSGEILFDWSLYKLFKNYWNKKTILFKEYWSLDYKRFDIENDPKVLEIKIKEIFDTYKVEDLKVENVQMEDVIQRFYK